jgi:5-methylcytosine-specific restriction endonuclease McrA
MLGHFIPPENWEAYQIPYVEPTPEPFFIFWLFRYRCIMCKRNATEINEIIPRSRSKKSVMDWKNRVPLCSACHRTFHAGGVTDKKIEEMQRFRTRFLISIDRKEYT